MTEPADTPHEVVRASDAERDAVATRITAAVGEGRLSVTEADERLDVAYHARYRHELDALTEDLPDGGRARAGRARIAVVPVRLRVHAAVVVVVAVLLVARWLGSDVPYFWPAMPLLLLVASLVVHARAARLLPLRR